MIRRFFVHTLMLGLVFVSGCTIQPVPGASGSVRPGSGAVSEMATDVEIASEMPATYSLKPLDPIYIRFSGVADQQYLDMVIDEKGEINLLHIDKPVMAGGLSTSALEDKIERLYIDGGIYKTVSVNVTMTAKAYYVQGEVNAPGKFQLTAGTTLLQAIAEARGFTPFASRRITITRQGRIYEFNRKELEKDPSKDVKLEAGDVIKIWQSRW